MVSLTRDDAVRIVQVVHNLHDAIGEFLVECGPQPSPHSKASSELRTFPRRESLESAYSQGGILLEVTADQLMAFTKTATEPVQTIAPWTCIRSLLESAALGVWLLDPAIDARTRVRRSFALRYEGLVQQARFLRAAEGGNAIAEVNNRIAEVERVAQDLGFPRVEDKKKKRIGIGQKMPSVTDTIAQTLDEEISYRLLSAVAHAHTWALQHLSFRQVEASSFHLSTDGATDSSVHLLSKSLSPQQVAFLGDKAFRVFTASIRCKCELFGWPLVELERIIAEVRGHPSTDPRTD